ncbi:MAG: IclR family transcriptional regulator [Acidiferrobacterales bacterium]
MEKSATSSIQVIDRAAALLNAMAALSEPASLKFLSAETELHPSTAFRILNAMAEHGFVQRSDVGHYSLGMKLLHFGSRVRGNVDLLREARPIMEWLRSQVGETVNLTVREGDEVVYVERAIPNRMMRVEQVIGSRAPLHVTAVGKLFLAEAGENACREFAHRTGLPRYTPNTLVHVTRLWRQVEAAGIQGYALDDEEAEQGVGCIGAPVRDSHGTMVAGLSISAPHERRQQSWISLIMKAGKELSVRLGYSEKV